MSEDLPKQYEPEKAEDKWRQRWTAENLFHGNVDSTKEPYALTLPPPNVTGSLHMGHALGFTLQDILVRRAKMSGKDTMWMPGTDHAGIATQMLVERFLKRTENKTRHDLGRDGFLERVWQWKDKHGGRIVEQMKNMGFALDWQRERFTMDESSSAAVRKVFVSLFEEGLIYRAERLVNWDPGTQTVVSDLEVDNIEEPGQLWEIRYPVVGSDEAFTVATTRPETMLGDTGVAVHPEDERYKHLVGKKVALPLCDREIPIVADSFVDPEFGSGAVKVTPAHDFNDFECGKRCQLPLMTIIDRDANIISPAPEAYVGLTVTEARKKVVADLDAQGFLVNTKDYTVPRARSQRSGAVIEPLLSKQWFVKTEPLATPAIKAVEDGRTKFIPELWSKTYMHWMKNIKDWCISRQLWWGHQIPAWHCQDCEEIIVAEHAPAQCKCGSQSLRQDDDVLDTWFSSGLWPFSTLGWPEKTDAYKHYYPNAVLVTGPDIIFFWVARMMMMGLHFAGDVPFHEVYLTPIVTDDKGDKMSKTKGNVIDPLDVINGVTVDALVERAKADGLSDKAIKNIKKQFADGINAAGVDALRFSLCAMTMTTGHIRLSLERVEGYRHFINKLWNASRFALMNLGDCDVTLTLDDVKDNMSLADRWIVSQLQAVKQKLDEGFAQYRFSEVANTLYHFVWGDFCDWYIELSKERLRSEDKAAKAASQTVLLSVLKETLALLAPITPFVTEELASHLPGAKDDCLLAQSVPTVDESWLDAQADEDMAQLQAMITAIRTIRATYRLPPSKSVEARFVTDDAKTIGRIQSGGALVEQLARATVKVLSNNDAQQLDASLTATSVVNGELTVAIPLGGLIDIGAERQRLKRSAQKVEKEIKFVSGKLSNPKFVERAPEEVVAKERTKLESEQAKLSHLQEALALLDGNDSENSQDSSQ